jgi:hypothetical protein
MHLIILIIVVLMNKNIKRSLRSNMGIRTAYYGNKLYFRVNVLSYAKYGYL